MDFLGKNIDQNISRNLRGMLAMRQKPLEQAKQSAIDALKTTSKRVVQETAETIGDLIGNKTSIQKFHSKMIQKQLRMRMIKKYISPEERQKVIDNHCINIIV